MDFREITERLAGATIEIHSIDLAGRTLQLTSPAVTFQEISILKWNGNTTRGPLSVSVIGLEKLGPGEPWRLYIRTSDGAELEITCGSVTSDGKDVTGIGRSYRH